MLHLFVNLGCMLIFVGGECENQRDAQLSPTELIAAYGYPAESHTVQTEDGYLLTLHRIPHGVAETSERPGRPPPVLVMHGLHSSSMDWVITKPGHALGFILADAGYDVWLGNFRGNLFSKNHMTLSNTSKEFWNFSWHENGKFDLPAMIDYIMQETEVGQMFYVGHSMGTTSFFVMLSLRPDYNRNIRVMCALAPVAFVNHIKSPLLKTIAWSYRGRELLVKVAGMYEFLPRNKTLERSLKKLCPANASFHGVCSHFMFILTGWDPILIDEERFPAILAHFPAGASSKQLFHYAQEVVSGHFREWDNGVITNLLQCTIRRPADYVLSNIVAPIVLFYSSNDWLSTPIDVLRLYGVLEKTAKLFHIPYENFTHMDFLWAKDAKRLVYDSILDIFTEYEYQINATTRMAHDSKFNDLHH